MSDDLATALNRLDVVFADPPPLTGPVRGCGLCWADEDLAALGAPPAEVPERVLELFVSEVVDHLDFGDQYMILWRRLAPRALRRIAAGEHDLDLFYGIKLGTYGGKLKLWPEPERAAVTAVLDALLRTHLVAYPDGEYVIDVLEGLIETTGEAASWLDRLGDSAAAEAGLLVFAHDVVDWALWQVICGTAGLFRKATEALVEWLAGPVFAERLARHAAEHPDCGIARETAAAVASLGLPEAERRYRARTEGRCEHG